MAVASDALTPVLIGSGQHAERSGDADYSALSPVNIAACAPRAASADAGVAASEIDAVVAATGESSLVRQMTFQIQVLFDGEPFGRSVYVTAAGEGNQFVV